MSNKKICISIPVYKFVRTKLIEDLIHENLYDIILFTQSNDENKHKYDIFKNDVRIIELNCDNIFTKRELMLEQMIALGYNGAFCLDDDVCAFGYKITEETKRTTSNSYAKIKVPVEEVFNKLLDVANTYDAGYVSLNKAMFIGFAKPDKINVNKSINTTSFVYVDIDKLRDNDIHYDTSGEYHEDLQLVIDLLQKHITCATICDYAFEYEKENKNSLIRTDYSYDQFQLNLCKRYKFPIKLYFKNERMMCKVPFKNLYDGTPYKTCDEEITKICNENNVEKLREYLHNLKNNN